MNTVSVAASSTETLQLISEFLNDRFARGGNVKINGIAYRQRKGAEDSRRREDLGASLGSGSQVGLRIVIAKHSPFAIPESGLSTCALEKSGGWEQDIPDGAFSLVRFV
jgi:hypothetical protein